MSKKIKQTKGTKSVARIFTICEIFLILTPFIACIYCSMLASSASMSFREILSSHPSVTVIFLLAMVNPYAAYILKLIKQKLDNGNYQFVVINFLLLLIAQMLTLNTLYACMIGYAFYKTIKVYNIPVKKTLKEINFKKYFSYGGGSLIIMSFSLLSLFVTIKLL
ncbi:MAG: hypothetical protein PHH04_07980 [Thomasclavelia sp.]|nr:hypothetical protein [Thomasclavelia sp.]